MPVLLAVAPLLLVMALLASGRVSALPAGAAGLAATLLVVLIAPPGNTALLPFLAHNTFVGAWLAWQVIAIVLGGIFFAFEPAISPGSPRRRPRRRRTICIRVSTSCASCWDHSPKP